MVADDAERAGEAEDVLLVLDDVHHASRAAVPGIRQGPSTRYCGVVAYRKTKNLGRG
jgi:hypothetical protein